MATFWLGLIQGNLWKNSVLHTPVRAPKWLQKYRAKGVGTTIMPGDLPGIWTADFQAFVHPCPVVPGVCLPGNNEAVRGYGLSVGQGVPTATQVRAL